VVVLLHGKELVVLHDAEAVDDVGAEAGVHVLGDHGAEAGPLHGPVGEVADEFVVAGARLVLALLHAGTEEEAEEEEVEERR